ncbi:hypothetical protein ACQCVP_23685 [Rossellomorea vietnamensis]
MPVGADQGASTFYTGEAEEAHRPPRGVVRLEWKSISFPSPQSLRKQPLEKNLKQTLVDFRFMCTTLREVYLPLQSTMPKNRVGGGD